MRHIIFLLTFSIIIISCGQTDNKQKELELKEKELALKEKGIYLDSVEKSKKAETPTSNSVATVSQSPIDIPEKNNAMQNVTGDRDKFIGTFTWSGECASGCFYNHVFNQNGTVKTTFETARSSETYTEKWTVDENAKVIKIGKDKWRYKFVTDKIKLTSVQYPLDTHDLTREK